MKRFGSGDLELREVDRAGARGRTACWCACARRRSIPLRVVRRLPPLFVRVAGGRCGGPGDVARRRPGRAGRTVGADVTRFQPGDEVSAPSAGSWPSTRRPARTARTEAGERVVRGGRRGSRAGLTALQAVRDQAGPPGPEGPDQRRRRGVGRSPCRSRRRSARDVTAVCSTANVDRRARSAPTTSSITRARTSRASTSAST